VALEFTNCFQFASTLSSAEDLHNRGVPCPRPIRLRDGLHNVLIARFWKCRDLIVRLYCHVPNDESLVVITLLPTLSVTAAEARNRRLGIRHSSKGSKIGIGLPTLVNTIDAMDNVAAH